MMFLITFYSFITFNFFFFNYSKVLYKCMLTDDYFGSGLDEKDLKELLKGFFDMYSLS